MLTLKVNARNDIHLPAKILKSLNLGGDRIVKAVVEGNTLVIIPVDLELRYSPGELAAVDKIHDTEKKKGFVPLKSAKDIDRLLK